MSTVGALVLAYFVVILPSWFAAEVWASQPAANRSRRAVVLWATRALALGGVAWGLVTFVLGSGGLWSDVADLWRAYYPDLLRGYRVTIVVTVVSFVLALAVGIVAALLRTADIRTLRVLSGAYIEWFRNTPLLIQLFFWFFAVP